MELLRSSLLTEHGFLHAFSTRRDGVSAAPFDSLNFGRALGDDDRAVAENHRRLAEAVRYSGPMLFEASQVHGAVVLEARADMDATSTRAVEADALVAYETGVAVGVRTADCLPLLLADPASGAVAAVHAGWRGAAAGIALRAIETLSQRGAKAENLVAAIGPHIRACCFEVGREVLDALAAASGVDVTMPSNKGNSGNPHADLAKAVRAQLQNAGVRHVDDTGGCTCCDASRFFSFRRDAKQSGRQLSVIVGREVSS